MSTPIAPTTWHFLLPQGPYAPTRITGTGTTELEALTNALENTEAYLRYWHNSAGYLASPSEWTTNTITPRLDYRSGWNVTITLHPNSAAERRASLFIPKGTQT